MFSLICKLTLACIQKAKHKSGTEESFEICALEIYNVSLVYMRFIHADSFIRCLYLQLAPFKALLQHNWNVADFLLKHGWGSQLLAKSAGSDINPQCEQIPFNASLHTTVPFFTEPRGILEGQGCELQYLRWTFPPSYLSLCSARP